MQIDCSEGKCCDQIMLECLYFRHVEASGSYMIKIQSIPIRKVASQSRESVR